MASNLSSSSTDAEVRSCYQDNANFEESESLTKARAFVTACLHLLQREPASVAKGGSEMRLTPEQIQKELAYARQWIAQRSDSDFERGGPRYVRASFRSGGRG